MGRIWHTWIVESVNANWTINVVESNLSQGANWIWIVSRRTIDPTKDTSIEWYYVKPELAQEKVFSALKVEQAIAKIPTKLKDNVMEWQKWKKLWQEALKQSWWDVWQAALIVSWWDINEDNKVLWDKLWKMILSTITDSAFNPWPVSSLINSENRIEKAQWIDAIERYKMMNNDQTRWSSWNDSSKVNYAFDTIQWIEDKMESLQSWSFWLWDWTLENIDSALENNADVVRFKADLENLFWPLRTEKFWVNLTWNEEKYVNSFMPDIKDPEENIKSKMDSLKFDMLRQYNSIRKANFIPALTEDQFLNKEQLVDIYTEDWTQGWQFQTKTWFQFDWKKVNKWKTGRDDFFKKW